MTLLVEDLLLLARLDAGRPLQYEQTDLVPLVIDAVSDARAAGRDHNWRLELPDEPALVLADAARLQQVMVNLFANARTHTPPGTTVTARVHQQGPWLCVDVQDDGQGIPPTCSRASSNASHVEIPRVPGPPVRPVSGLRSCRPSHQRMEVP